MFAKEEMKYEINKVVHPDRTKHVVREKRLAHFADLQRFRLCRKRNHSREQACNEKCYEVIADQKKQRRREFRIFHSSDTDCAARIRTYQK